jgi:fatty-acyl-CoA synthase
LRKVVPASVFEWIERESITMMCAAPTVLIGIASAPDEVRQDVRQGIRVLTAGAPPAAATIERVEEELGWTITQVYGMTETAPFITICEPRPEHESLSVRERAAIKARQGVELITSGDLRVVNENGEEVPRDGETLGEIVVRGNVVMKGYFNDPDATAHAFRGGWMHTGDAAVVHPDGYAEVRDRIKDIENISSIEVEGILLRHPAVQEVAVVGMAHEKWGEAPYAFVVLREGAKATEAELRDFARQNMAHFKVPQEFRFLAALPKTATGKIQKYVLRGRKSAISHQ